MRGKVCIPLWCSVTAGITPAYAGERDKPLVIVSTITDHPRVCGEKALSTFSSLKNSGSPPRMRGKVQNQEALSAGNGITPAYAGKRKSCVVQKINAWDHPRVCGEKMPCSPWGMILVGSPPRMRGKGFCPCYQCGRYQDDPRVCGEKDGSIDNLRDGLGSPPRMRGKG